MPGLPTYREANWTAMLTTAIARQQKLQPSIVKEAITDYADAHRLIFQWMETRAVALKDRHLVLDVWPRQPLLSLFSTQLHGEPDVYTLPEYINGALRLTFDEAVFREQRIGIVENDIKQYQPIVRKDPMIASTIILSDVLHTIAMSPSPILRNLGAYAGQDTTLYLSTPVDAKLGKVYKFVTGIAELPVTEELAHQPGEPIWYYSKEEIEAVLVGAGWRPVRLGYVLSGRLQYMNVAAVRLTE